MLRDYALCPKGARTYDAEYSWPLTQFKPLSPRPRPPHDPLPLLDREELIRGNRP